jgi:hypothetical protein
MDETLTGFYGTKEYYPGATIREPDFEIQLTQHKLEILAGKDPTDYTGLPLVEIYAQFNSYTGTVL